MASSQRTPPPDLLEVVGGWLARAPVTSPFRFAVLGSTPEEATGRYEISYGAWERLGKLAARFRGTDSDALAQVRSTVEA